MSTTYSNSGGARLEIELVSRFGGDSGGSRIGRMQQTVAWEPVGGASPQLSGWLRGAFLPAAGELRLAHPTDPLGGMGDSQYSDGLTPEGARLHGFWVKNNDAAASLTLTRAVSGGAPIFEVAGDGLTLGPGEQCLLLFTGGRGPLQNGISDGVTIAVSAAFTTAADIFVIYGP